VAYFAGRPLARYLVGGVIGPHAPNPLNTAFGGGTAMWLTVAEIACRDVASGQAHAAEQAMFFG
jgi:hypothetical protein